MKEYKIRRLLWINHGCGLASLYGDDGKMQCNTCMIDFKRDHEDDIERKLQKRGIKKLNDYYKNKANK